MKQEVQYIDLDLETKLEPNFDESRCEMDVVEEVLQTLNIDFDSHEMIMI